MDNNILVQNLCKQFEGFFLDNVSFKVPKGRIVGFIGENGAGKSTTINLILNELNKDSGQIQVFGIDHTIPTVKENIGVVFDECNFHDVFTATDIEKILKGIYKTWDSNLFLQYLKKFKIPTQKMIGAFSKGMKMKLSIICAMAHRPKLLILDEATTGLDPVVRDEVLDLFLEFIQDEDCSIFFSSHITSDIQKIADYTKLTDVYKKLMQNYGRKTDKDIKAVVRITTSDVGVSGANVFYSLQEPTRNVILGNALKVTHKNCKGMEDFTENIESIFDYYREVLKGVMRLCDIWIEHPANAMAGIMKQAGFGKKLLAETVEQFKATTGNEPCSAYEIYCGICESIIIARQEKTNERGLLALEEKIAGCVSKRWHEYDIPGTVKY